MQAIFSRSRRPTCYHGAGMRRLFVFAVCVLAAGAGLRAQDPDADRISLELLLGRGGWYVFDFIE